MKERIISELKNLTHHNHIEILTRGNSALFSALHAAKKEVLLPEEGGWLTYLIYPKKLGLKSEKVKCSKAIINLKDLERRLATRKFSLFLYQNPGGYHAEQPMKEIYQICKNNHCQVILDASGGIGTRLCAGKYADLIVCSFNRWKLINAGFGGFISCKNKETFNKIKDSFRPLDDKNKLRIILEKINSLQNRISFLSEKRKKIIKDLKDFNLINKNHLGFVLIVKFATEKERENIINYCKTKHLEYTECPRYIRINQKAISIEIKRLEEK